MREYIRLKNYCVVYLSNGGMHYRFRCVTENKREAKRICRELLGVSNKDITDVYEESEEDCSL